MGSKAGGSCEATTTGASSSSSYCLGLLAPVQLQLFPLFSAGVAHEEAAAEPLPAAIFLLSICFDLFGEAQRER